MRENALKQLKEYQMKDLPEMQFLFTCENSSKMYTILDTQLEEKKRIADDQRNRAIKLDLITNKLQLEK